MCRKEYRAGYAAHLKNKDIVRLWGGQKEMGTLRDWGSWKMKPQALVGDWEKTLGIPLEEGCRQMPPRESKRVGNCSYSSGYKKQTK